MLSLILAAQIASCTVVKVHDADGPLWCADGRKIRVAGVNARETDGSCSRNAPCPVMRHQQAKPIVERMVLRKTLRCRKVGVSYSRSVEVCTLPDGRDLRCALLRTGAVARWVKFERLYRLEACPR